MKNRLLLALSVIYMTLSMACHVDLPNDDITVINDTKDTVYYYIGAYKFKTGNIRNMAFEQVTDLTTNKTIDSIPRYTFNPGDTIHPSLMNKSWKKFAAEKGGLTILVYKRDIETLSPKASLTPKNIFRRVDLTAKQLDSLKYKIVIN